MDKCNRLTPTPAVQENDASDIDDVEITTTEASMKDIENNTQGKYAMWAVSGINYFPCEETLQELPPYQYTIDEDRRGALYFSKTLIELDKLLNLPDSTSERIIRAIDKFWTREKYFREFGFLWKRGVLLWGPQGSGKTCTVQQLSKQIIDKGGISIYCTHPLLVAHGLKILRKIEPTRPIVVIIEDIDAVIERYGESDMLALLDGELQIDNVVFVATTNYPENLDKRLKDRPSRFDEVIYVGMPTPECREYYLSHKNPKLADTPEEMKRWVDATEGFSIAHLKEVIVSVECLGNDLESTIERLQKMRDANISSAHTDSKRKAGFV